MLAVLSLGLVGLSDQLSDVPSSANASITSNLTLVRATSSSTGTLLQPSHLLVPVERMLTNVGEFGDGQGGACPRTAGPYSFGCGKNLLWATCICTVVPSATAANQTLLWWTALAFGDGKGANAGSFMLLESDLAPMVDTNQTIGQFSDIPRAAFEGASASFASTSQLYASLQADIIQQRSCDGVIVSPWTSSYNIMLPTARKNTTDGPTAPINLAPVFGSVALLGEAGAA
eukprot:SAG31_NODE_10192_length_1172_cov_1.525629_1_plen_231_part_00